MEHITKLGQANSPERTESGKKSELNGNGDKERYLLIVYPLDGIGSKQSFTQSLGWW